MEETKKKDYSHLVTGFIKCNVIDVNPPQETIEEYIGEEMEKPPVYTWTKDGVRKAIIDIYLRDVSENIYKHRIVLADEEDVSKSGKKKYINCVGDIQWADDESQLWDSFKLFEEIKWSKDGKIENKKTIGRKEYHVARKGEEQLLHYSKMLWGVNVKNEETNLFYDLDEIFEDNFDELRAEIKNDSGEYDFIALLYITDDLKQKVWREFLPVEMLREINNNLSFTQYTRKKWENWKANLENEYTGLMNGHYSLSRAHVFTEKDFIIKKEISEDGPDF